MFHEGSRQTLGALQVVSFAYLAASGASANCVAAGHDLTVAVWDVVESETGMLGGDWDEEGSGGLASHAVCVVVGAGLAVERGSASTKGLDTGSRVESVTSNIVSSDTGVWI